MDLQKIKSPKISKKPSLFGFTLIELIVVITILAILGTIGFLSIGSYSSRARDSSRLTDTANISKSLDLSIITRGTYPNPDTFFSVTYSGGTIWKQGKVGATVLQAMRSSISGGGLNKKPVDPLDKTEYTYSSLEYGKAFQIKVNYEGDVNQAAYYFPSPISTTYAAASQEYDSKLLLMEAYIRGNYGGLTAKTITGETTYLLAIPSIITNTGSVGDVLAIESNALSGTLLFNGKPLVNASSYNPNMVTNSGVVYSSTGGALGTDLATTLVTNLQAAYQGSDIANNSNIASLLSITGSTVIQNYGVNIVNTQLGGNLSGGGSSGNNGTTSTCTSWTYTPTQVCQPNGQQTVSIATSIPTGCTGGNPLTTQACIYTPTHSCLATPTFANIGVINLGYPSSFEQAWIYSATPGNCTYSCINGYSGMNCLIAPITYGWVFQGTWGSCSTSCGGGTQTRTVVCKNNSGTTVADSFCTEMKPTVSQSCNTQTCTSTSWQCPNGYVWSGLSLDCLSLVSTPGSNQMCHIPGTQTLRCVNGSAYVSNVSAVAAPTFR
ncbi:MAG: prepilin-type N-terminal cleavage/methylation domain-containing protein [Candidatus Gracilibacteria bacterium]|nr:prepilin-type N-terminal cleavage/methylation domain-containing protein [Candidatus Gracilibacteria bacterium]